MTVVEPIPSTALRKSVIDKSSSSSLLPDNVRQLDLRRATVSESASDLDAHPVALDFRDGSCAAASAGHTAVPFLSRIRAWMVVLPTDLAMIVAPMAWRPHQIYPVVAMAILTVFLLTGGARYHARLHLSILDELPTILGRLLTATAAVAAVIILLRHGESVTAFLETACQSIGLVLVGRIVTTRFIALARRKGITSYRTILIGGGPLAAELAKILNEHALYGLKVVGFVDDDRHCAAEKYAPRLGRLADLDDAVAETHAATLLVAEGSFEEQALMDAVRTTQCRGRDLLVVPRMHNFHTQTGMADHIGDIPIMRIRNPNLHGAARLIKRLFDVVFATAAMIVLLPMLTVVALAVRLEGGPGVIFRQVRVGRDGKQFQCLKFRTMRPSDEIESDTRWSVATDSRVGPVGRFLRCTSIDELPQLWNIVRGDMALVGPRPERPYFVEQFSMQFHRYTHRHRVQVGLTGFAQVSGLRGDTSIADRARFDNFYIENWSLWMDIKIVLRTFREVLLRRGC